MHGVVQLARRPVVRRVALAVVAATALSVAGAAAASRARMADAQATLSEAVVRLDELTDVGDQDSRAAIAWGYDERLRLGLESPFRLVEAASRDPRLQVDERRTVALALLARITEGATHEVDPAALDGIGPVVAGRPLRGEVHLRLIEDAIVGADDPRDAELGVRIAYALAATERLVEPAGPLLAAQAAALVADRELARREAIALLRSSRDDAIEAITRRRAARRFYVERPVLLGAGDRDAGLAVQLGERLLAALRRATPDSIADAAPADSTPVVMRRALYDAGSLAPPNGALAVTLQRYRQAFGGGAKGRDGGRDALPAAQVHNAEMLVGSLRDRSPDRARRRGVARALLAAAVAMRSSAQERVWFAGDTAPTAAELVASTGLGAISFDADVPVSWRPYFLVSLADAVTDLRRVLPGFRFQELRVRFRATPPADSALAMHDPRTRTLHLPVYTVAGTLTHELAHDLDRQSAVRQGHAGYRTDYVARANPPAPMSRLAASLRALTEEVAGTPNRANRNERPAEIFATRVDWFVAQALAATGRSSGFLSAVQDEMLTGHVVHPERLRSAASSSSLVIALREMAGAPASAGPAEPSLHTLLRWATTAPVDAQVAAGIVRGEDTPWGGAFAALAGGACDAGDDPRVQLLHLAADARARGWVQQRAQWTAAADRPAWARAAMDEAPWSPALVEHRVARLRNHVLTALAASEQLPSGIGAYVAPIASRARCAG